MNSEGIPGRFPLRWLRLHVASLFVLLLLLYVKAGSDWFHFILTKHQPSHLVCFHQEMTKGLTGSHLKVFVLIYCV